MEYFKNLPRGKQDKPVLLLQGSELIWDCEECDGALAMLNRDFSGCVVLTFSKPIDYKIPGRITLHGTLISYVHHSISFMGGLELIGAYVAPYVDKYDTIYTLHVEAFTDTDGNRMHPVDIPLRTLPKAEVNPSFAERDRLSLQAAEEGIVLMKNNENALPLKDTVWNIFGHDFHRFRDCAAGAGRIHSRYTFSFKRAIRESEDISFNEELADFYRRGNGALPDEGMLRRAKSGSDTALVVLSRFGGENTDASSAKGEFYLSDEEDAMLRLVSDYFSKTVVILNVPAPMDVRFIETYGIDALVYCGFPGMMGGQALLNILCGKVNPSGKLTDTWAKKYEDIPASRNFYDCVKDGPRYDADANVWIDTVYEENLYVGYRYFDTFGVNRAYGFGHGLSYTKFSAEAKEMCFDMQEGLMVKAQIDNIGRLSGKETAQLYISKPEFCLEQCKRELIAFEKTPVLLPGETTVLCLHAPINRLQSFNPVRSAYVLCAGEYEVWLGNSLAASKKIGSFLIEEEKILKQVPHRVCPVVSIDTLSKRNPQETWPAGEHSGIQNVTGVYPPRKTSPYTPAAIPKGNGRFSFSKVIDNPDLAFAYAASLSVEELCRLTVCSKDDWNMAGFGIGGRLAVPATTDIPPFTVADGNSGVKADAKITGFPASTVYASTFNKALVYEIGRLLGQEALENGVDLITGPGMNLHRNPLNGRNIEYFSEDPYLTGCLAGYFALGIEDMGVGANYKHFIANNCEISRKRNQSLISERTIRELYLRSFQYALEVCHVSSVMTAYNAVNGLHTAADSELLEGLLREESGFTGYVMTDWNSYQTCDMIDMLLAGNNWLTPGSADDTYTRPLEEAVKAGRLPVSVLQESVGRMLRTVAAIYKRRNKMNKEEQYEI